LTKAIPRLAVVKINGQEHHSQGYVPAEWVISGNKKNVRTMPPETQKAILYLHGGSYVVASSRTHRGITSRIAKFTNSRVFGTEILM
jgi:acetyl esterase/lipase